ncbi:MAG: hypothetical protein JRH20_21005, partial [Deltaproteobacteria bacterium]|nr:hypothetical protein [Deltaproteobacteria bacterium]
KNCVPADDADLAGGDPFDLADISLHEARYLRIRDSGLPSLAGDGTAGFDLDAVVLIHYRRLD